MKNIFQTALNKTQKFWFGPIDTIALDTFRMCLGFAILLYMRFRWIYVDEWLTTKGFHINFENLPLHDFGVPLLPEKLLPLFGIIFFTSIIAFILGWCFQWTRWIVLACLVYVTAADQLSAFSPNKILIASVFILCLAPVGSYWSIHPKRDRMQPAWGLRILQATMIIHLFMSGWNKAYFGEWLINPHVLWTQVQGTYRTEAAAFLLRVLPTQIWTAMQAGALLFELLAPALFLRKSLRKIGLVWGLVFQMMIAVTMHHLGYFNLIMICYLVLFIDDQALHRCKQSLSKNVDKYIKFMHT